MLNAVSTRPGVVLREAPPAVAADLAAALLRRAWQPPALLYSQEYVAWQLAFPGAERPRLFAAEDGSRVLGTIAAMPRRLELPAGGVVSLPVISFFAVDPDLRGGGIGAELVRLLLENVRPPLLLFVQPGSQSERVFERSAAECGMPFARLATLKTFGRLGTIPAPAGVTVKDATPGEFVDAVAAIRPAPALWSRPALEAAAHYARDPRGACLALALDTDGVPLGAARLVQAQIVTAHGIEHTASIDSAWMDGEDDQVLSAFGSLAAARWDQAGVVTAPSLQGMSAGALARAGFRATRSSFTLCAIGPAPAFSSTNLEVF